MDIATSRNGKRLLIAWFGVLLVFLYAPLLLLLVFSFNEKNLPVFPLECCTTQAYQDFVGNAELSASLLTSAKVAAGSSVVAVLLGILAAIFWEPAQRRFAAQPV
jgi:spermidine/putrescine transport system permease protein